MARVTVQDAVEKVGNRFDLVPVSYTHLTLPTSV